MVLARALGLCLLLGLSLWPIRDVRAVEIEFAGRPVAREILALYDSRHEKRASDPGRRRSRMTRRPPVVDPSADGHDPRLADRMVPVELPAQALLPVTGGHLIHRLHTQAHLRGHHIAAHARGQR